MLRKILFVFFGLVVISNVAAAKKNSDFHIGSAQTTPKVFEYIREYYVDPTRIDYDALLKGALNAIQKNTAEILITFDGTEKFTVTIDKAVKKFDSSRLLNFGDLWGVLKKVYTFIEMHYHGSVDTQDIEYVAIDGMLSELDPHSNILPPKVYNEFKVGTHGKFGGIGIVIGNRDGELTVISPIEGTPAWNAGIKTGDKIIQIGDESTINMNLTEAVEILRGDPGTPVTLTVLRKGRSAPFNVTLKRAIINIDSVQSMPMNIDDRTIGYIKIKNFQEDTSKEFSRQLDLLRKEPNFSGLIIDLRNDPGGLLNQAVEVVDKFISEGVIVSTIGAGDKFVEQERAKGSGTEPPYPIIVLVNEGSASASEIVAGTLQSYRRAAIMGTETFGKGSVQTVYDLSDGSALKLTIAEYLTAGKNSIQTIGVMPDIKLIAATVDREKMDLAEDEHESEKTLEKHLSHYADASQKEASYRLTYLQPSEKKDKENEELDRRDYSKTLDLSRDNAVNFAAKILVRAPTDSYTDLLKSAKNVIDDINKAEDLNITAALSKASVNWENCKPEGKPVLQVSYQLMKNNTIIREASAGDDVTLVLNAKNIGTGPFCRLIGISDSKESFLKNIEFVFGKLAPGGSQNASVPIKLPKSLATGNLALKIKFNESNANHPFEFKAIIPEKELPQPKFAFQFKVGEPINVKVASKPMPVGKTVPFIVDIKNLGPGAAPNTFVTIKGVDTKGLFIETGRVKLGRIEPNQSKTATFKFKIEESLAKSTFELEFSIVDYDILTYLTKKIEFNVPAGTTEPPAYRWYEGPKIALTGAEPFIVTSSARHKLSGKITDDFSVKDYFIFANEEKVAYSANPIGSNSMDFSADIPLKDGNNEISIMARDELDLMTKKTVIIEKK